MFFVGHVLTITGQNKVDKKLHIGVDTKIDGGRRGIADISLGKHPSKNCFHTIR